MYKECLEYCGLALQFRAAARARADLLEWMAISQASLGFPRESVEAVFRAALNLSPDNPRIEQNYRYFKEDGLSMSPSLAPWRMDREEDLRSFGASENRPASGLMAIA
jgi:hypothetical protein